MRPQSPVDLTLVIPCYNEEGHLRDSISRLHAALRWSQLNYDIILVDDCSRDGTRTIITELCRESENISAVFHQQNRGRGGAFKTGFRAATGTVTGFIDIDLEVGPHYVPVLVRHLLEHDLDIVTGYRYYALHQTRGLFRAFLSWAYHRLRQRLLFFGIEDSETGCKFFRRATTQRIVLGCHNDGWFWDTEVMARGVLANLGIAELPVLFLRRFDKASTVRPWRDAWAYFTAMMRFRRQIGLGFGGRSPLYWWRWSYDAGLRVVLGREHDAALQRVAALVPVGASVLDVCAGSAKLASMLAARDCVYIAYDFNARLVLAAQAAGLRAVFGDVRTDDLPPADFVLMCSSLYHFHRTADEVLAKLRAAASQGVIICEPVSNLSHHGFGLLAKMANRLSDPGGHSDYQYRYSLESFTGFCKANGGTLHHQEGQPIATAVFSPAPRAARSEVLAEDVGRGRPLA